ncbi:unnamed protein product [Orchesella dallaii]|uniref:EGF-like domain-containing protein n=1 Tax=Orchesella dallaii TaxID=48710 RepID=A0ABP1QQ00_9HEXA
MFLFPRFTACKTGFCLIFFNFLIDLSIGKKLSFGETCKPKAASIQHLPETRTLFGIRSGGSDNDLFKSGSSQGERVPLGFETAQKIIKRSIDSEEFYEIRQSEQNALSNGLRNHQSETPTIPLHSLVDPEKGNSVENEKTKRKKKMEEADKEKTYPSSYVTNSQNIIISSSSSRTPTIPSSLQQREQKYSSRYQTVSAAGYKSGLEINSKKFNALQVGILPTEADIHLMKSEMKRDDQEREQQQSNLFSQRSLQDKIRFFKCPSSTAAAPCNSVYSGETRDTVGRDDAYVTNYLLAKGEKKEEEIINGVVNERQHDTAYEMQNNGPFQENRSGNVPIKTTTFGERDKNMGVDDGDSHQNLDDADFTDGKQVKNLHHVRNWENKHSSRVHISNETNIHNILQDGIVDWLKMNAWGNSREKHIIQLHSNPNFEQEEKDLEISSMEPILFSPKPVGTSSKERLLNAMTMTTLIEMKLKENLLKCKKNRVENVSTSWDWHFKFLCSTARKQKAIGSSSSPTGNPIQLEQVVKGRNTSLRTNYGLAKQLKTPSSSINSNVGALNSVDIKTTSKTHNIEMLNLPFQDANYPKPTLRKEVHGSDIDVNSEEKMRLKKKLVEERETRIKMGEKVLMKYYQRATTVMTPVPSIILPHEQDVDKHYTKPDSNLFEQDLRSSTPNKFDHHPSKRLATFSYDKRHKLVVENAYKSSQLFTASPPPPSSSNNQVFGVSRGIIEEPKQSPVLPNRKWIPVSENEKTVQGRKEEERLTNHVVSARSHSANSKEEDVTVTSQVIKPTSKVSDMNGMSENLTMLTQSLLPKTNETIKVPTKQAELEPFKNENFARRWMKRREETWRSRDKRNVISVKSLSIMSTGVKNSKGNSETTQIVTRGKLPKITSVEGNHSPRYVISGARDETLVGKRTVSISEKNEANIEDKYNDGRQVPTSTSPFFKTSRSSKEDETHRNIYSPHLSQMNAFNIRRDNVLYSPNSIQPKLIKNEENELKLVSLSQDSELEQFPFQVSTDSSISSPSIPLDSTQGFSTAGAESNNINTLVMSTTSVSSSPSSFMSTATEALTLAPLVESTIDLVSPTYAVEQDSNGVTTSLSTSVTSSSAAGMDSGSSKTDSIGIDMTSAGVSPAPLSEATLATSMLSLATETSGDDKPESISIASTSIVPSLPTIPYTSSSLSAVTENSMNMLTVSMDSTTKDTADGEIVRETAGTSTMPMPTTDQVAVSSSEPHTTSSVGSSVTFEAKPNTMEGELVTIASSESLHTTVQTSQASEQSSNNDPPATTQVPSTSGDMVVTETVVSSAKFTMLQQQSTTAAAAGSFDSTTEMGTSGIPTAAAPAVTEVYAVTPTDQNQPQETTHLMSSVTSNPEEAIQTTSMSLDEKGNEEQATSTNAPIPSSPLPPPPGSAHENSEDYLQCDEIVGLECSGKTEQCVCKTGMEYNDEQKKCIGLLGSECKRNENSCISDGECVSGGAGDGKGICQCKVGFVSADDKRKCLPGLNAKCSSGGENQCHPNFECPRSAGKCSCRANQTIGVPHSSEGNVATSGLRELKCFLDYGSYCTVSDDHCNHFRFLKCSRQNSKCECADTKNQLYNSIQRTCVSRAATACKLGGGDGDDARNKQAGKDDIEMSSIAPCIGNSTCVRPKNETDSSSSVGICKCLDEFDQHWQGYCVMKGGAGYMTACNISMGLLVMLLTLMNYVCN